MKIYTHSIVDYRKKLKILSYPNNNSYSFYYKTYKSNNNEINKITQDLRLIINLNNNNNNVSKKYYKIIKIKNNNEIYLKKKLIKKQNFKLYFTYINYIDNNNNFILYYYDVELMILFITFSSNLLYNCYNNDYYKNIYQIIMNDIKQINNDLLELYHDKILTLNISSSNFISSPTSSNTSIFSPISSSSSSSSDGDLVKINPEDVALNEVDQEDYSLVTTYENNNEFNTEASMNYEINENSDQINEFLIAPSINNEEIMMIEKEKCIKKESIKNEQEYKKEKKKSDNIIEKNPLNISSLMKIIFTSNNNEKIILQLINENYFKKDAEFINYNNPIAEISSILSTWSYETTEKNKIKPLEIKKICIDNKKKISFIKNNNIKNNNFVKYNTYINIIEINNTSRIKSWFTPKEYDQILYYYDSELNTLFVSFSGSNDEWNKTNPLKIKRNNKILSNSKLLYNNFDSNHIEKIYNEVIRDIKIIKKFLKLSYLPIYFTGHSRGAMIADMIYYRCINRILDANKNRSNKKKLKLPFIHLYTFGIPSVEDDYNNKIIEIDKEQSISMIIRTQYGIENNNYDIVKCFCNNYDKVIKNSNSNIKYEDNNNSESESESDCDSETEYDSE